MAKWIQSEIIIHLKSEITERNHSPLERPGQSLIDQRKNKPGSTFPLSVTSVLDLNRQRTTSAASSWLSHLWGTITTTTLLYSFCVQLQTLLDDVKRETDMLKSQVANERSTKQNLESLMQENRTKEWQVQLAVQEKEAEIQLLRDRLQINDSKMSVVFAVLSLVCLCSSQG